METERVVSILDHEFALPERYAEDCKIVEQGYFGSSIFTLDRKIRHRVGIEKVENFDGEEERALKVLRRIRSMKVLCSHPNILKLFAVYVCKPRNELYFVTQLFDFSLLDLMGGRCLKESVSKCVMMQIVEALKYMHDRGVVHRELCPANILINKRMNVAITGFSGTCLTRPVPALVDGSVCEESYRYICPERMSLHPPDPCPAEDMWGAGAVLVAMLTGQALLDTINCEATFDLFDGESWFAGAPLKSFFPALHPPALSLLEGLLAVSPTRRLTAKMAKRHAFLSDAALLHDYDSSTIDHSALNEDLFFFDYTPQSMSQLRENILSEIGDFVTTY